MNPATGPGSLDERRREMARSLRTTTLPEFHDRLQAAGVTRAYVLYENGEFSLSHRELLAPIQAFFEVSHDFARHEGVFIGREEGVNTLFFAFVHDTRRGLSQGGLRFTHYPNLAEVLSDGLRLSQGMTRKNALAGLWWGGGKGIVALPPAYQRPEEVPLESPERQRIFEAYGRFVASIGGIYYTAEDVGTKTADMNRILSCNRFVTCIGGELGGSGNPSPHTAFGVFRAIQAAWLYLHGTDRLDGVRVTVQGAGNVGAPLIHLLDDAGARVWITDVNPQALEEAKQRWPAVEILPPDAIYDHEADVFAPCARGGVVNVETIPRLKVQLVCGAANNILGETEDAARLAKREILFVPDYLCNRMGITNCADEWLGYLEDDVRVAAERVYPDTLRVLRHAAYLGVTTVEAADELADIAAAELHPLLGHRGRRLTDHLVASGWAEPDRPRRGPATPPAFDPALDEAAARIRWEREGQYRGSGAAVVAAPVSTAARPDLAAVLAPLRMDVRARAREALGEPRPRRVAGADHGGLALQLAVERSLPVDRQSLGRPEFVALCRDVHSRNDAALREQLHALGAGFDPATWLDPFEERVEETIQRAFFSLKDAGLVTRESRHEHYCPRCASVLVASDLRHARRAVEERFTLTFRGEAGSVAVHVFRPEFAVGAVAILVRPEGPYAALAGSSVVNPCGGTLPVLPEATLTTDAELLVPSVARADAQLARQHGLPLGPPLFERGQVRWPGAPAPTSVEDARAAALTAFGSAAEREAGEWQVSVQRCGRCETVVEPDLSDQHFVHFGEAVGHLIQAIERGAVVFSSTTARDRVLAQLAASEPWCISRQYWWGNPIPGRGDEVFSTWFSLAGWTLAALGWPEHARPEPLAEVFIDFDWLLRWVVPSQLLALALTGRVAFHEVHVHGAVHVVDRRLVEREGAAPTDPDEERFLFRTARRPMRRGLGNVVEPGTLIRRFGADALRLGYLLVEEAGNSGVTTLSEGHLRRARRAIHTLNNKVTGIFTLVPRDTPPGPPTDADRALLVSLDENVTSALGAYRAHRDRAAAEELLAAIDHLARYADDVAQRRRTGANLAAVRPTTARALATLRRGFHPLCPFVLDKLERWTAERAGAALLREFPPTE